MNLWQDRGVSKGHTMGTEKGQVLEFVQRIRLKSDLEEERFVVDVMVYRL